MGKKKDNFSDASAKARSEKPKLSLTDAPYAYSKGGMNGLSDDAVRQIRDTSGKRGLGEYSVVHSGGTSGLSNKDGLTPDASSKLTSVLRFRGKEVGHVRWFGDNGTVDYMNVQPEHASAAAHLISTAWDFAEHHGMAGPQGAHLVSAPVAKGIVRANARATRKSK
jgi:hypothetical protein